MMIPVKNESDCLMVSVVVITWNQREDTLECLESVFRITYPNFCVVLVDNASTDGTREASPRNSRRLSMLRIRRIAAFGGGQSRDETWAGAAPSISFC